VNPDHSLVQFAATGLQQEGKGLAFAVARADDSLEQFIVDGLEDPTIVLLNESDFGPFADRVFFAQPRRYDQPALVLTVDGSRSI